MSAEALARVLVDSKLWLRTIGRREQDIHIWRDKLALLPTADFTVT